MILQGDCRDVLATLPADSVQCCVTSPPYWGLRDYGCDGQLGLEATPEEYVANMVEVFRGVRRVLRPDGVLWLNLGDSYARTQEGNVPQTKNKPVAFPKHSKAGGSDGGVGRGERPGSRASVSGLKSKDLVGIPWRVAFALQADGWWLRSDVIWHKPNPVPESVTDRPTKAHEYVFLLTKGGRYFYDAEAIAEPVAESTAADPRDGRNAGRPDRLFPGAPSRGATKLGGNGTRNARTVWSIPTKPFAAAHFAVMPEELARRCILAGSSERGCCPECRAPWERVVERERMVIAPSGRKDAMGEYGRTQTSGTMVSPPKSMTTGWRPTCDHDAQPVPCTVLDPFSGAGTVGLVAQEHGRQYVGVELNPEYIDIAERRLSQQTLWMAAG